MPVIEIVSAALDDRFPRRCRDVDRDVANEEVAFAANLFICSRAAVVLEFPWPKSAIQFGANSTTFVTTASPEPPSPSESPRPWPQWLS
jgi:hypothetical protein